MKTMLGFRNLGLTFLISLTIGSASTYAQEGTTGMIVDAERPKLLKTSVELDPLAVALSIVPGVGVISLSFEQYIGDKWTGYLSAGYGDAELDNRWTSTIEDETDAPGLESGYGYRVELGIRYYEDSIGDSFYGGVGVSYAQSTSRWDYEDVDIRNELETITPTVTAGYRWVWDNGFVARTAVGAGFPYINNEDFETSTEGEVASEGIDEVQNTYDQVAIPRLDVGLGYMF